MKREIKKENPVFSGDLEDRMLHAESLSGSLALLLWCSSDENGELTHI